MPVDLKLDFEDLVPSPGCIKMRQHSLSGELSEWVEPQVNELSLFLVANKPPTMKATFLVHSQESVVSLVTLVDPEVLTTYCLFCHGKLEREITPTGTVYWTCLCEVEPLNEENEE